MAAERQKLGDAEIDARLRALPNWKYDGGHLARSIALGSYRHGVRLVTRIADAAEGANHHPDMTLRYAALEVTLSTHDAGGVTARDFALARVIDDIAAD